MALLDQAFKRAFKTEGCHSNMATNGAIESEYVTNLPIFISQRKQ